VLTREHEVLTVNASDFVPVLEVPALGYCIPSAIATNSVCSWHARPTMATNINIMDSIPNDSEPPDNAVKDILSRVKYRVAKPTDIFQCFDMEKEAFSREVAASKNDLRYRQHHAAPFFRCAVLEHEDEENDEDVVIGYITSTRCEPGENDSSDTAHQHDSSSLMIHSMVVRKEFQRLGVGRHMIKNYMSSLEEFNATAENPIARVIAFVKDNLLTLYLHSGFSVLRPSRQTNGNTTLYLCESTVKIPSHLSSRHDAEMGSLDCYIVDSFAASPGTGNPAAVVLMPKETQAEAMAKWMHTVAAEFNLSETAFCWPRSSSHSTPNNEEHWNIRYFTPTVEVPLCGHATLASAAILYQTLKRSPDYKIIFHASEDDLTMERAEPGEETTTAFRTRISMEFPVKPPQDVVNSDDKLTVRMMLESAFACELDPLYVGLSDIGDILIELRPASFHDIGYEKINFKALMEWHGYYRGVIICCLNDAVVEPIESEDVESNDEPRADFLSRFFGPKAGINEDPVTGSAHCVLAPYFCKKLDKTTVIGKQTSERGGFVECLLKDESVLITGTAFTTVTGKLWMKKGETILRPRIARQRSYSMFEEE